MSEEVFDERTLQGFGCFRVFASFVTMLVTKVHIVVTIRLLSLLWTHQVCGSNTKLLLLYGRRVTCREWIHREKNVHSEKNSFT